LWWDIVNDDNDDGKSKASNKSLCETTQKILSEALHASLSEIMGADKDNDSSTTATTAWLVAVLERLCTLEHVGEIMGMLQCNVMEFEFPSPVPQYMDHLEMILEDDEDDHDDHSKEDDDNHTEECKNSGPGETTINKEQKEEWKSWIENYRSKHQPNDQQHAEDEATTTTTRVSPRGPNTTAQTSLQTPGQWRRSLINS
jgi:hypothetical protein